MITFYFDTRYSHEIEEKKTHYYLLKKKIKVKPIGFLPHYLKQNIKKVEKNWIPKETFMG